MPTERNIRLTVAYDGTHFAGWQVQKNAATIQGEIEKALQKILKEKIRLVAAGRTDSGVHARAQVAHFKTTCACTPGHVCRALNAILPEGISVRAARNVPLRFHAQFDAREKIYRYAILNDAVDDPFQRPFYCKVPYRLDLTVMKREARELCGRHDFKSFQAKSAHYPASKSTVRTVKDIDIRKAGRFVYIDIRADGFLHTMVRTIVGSLIEIARGRLAPGSMKKILASRNRKEAGPTAPAKGLALMRVFY
jgi:tRNA pseudouridine38-40 synthase